MTYVLTGECPRCGSELAARTRKRDGGRFVSCTGWPRCAFAADYNEALQEAARRRCSRA